MNIASPAQFLPHQANGHCCQERLVKPQVSTETPRTTWNSATATRILTGGGVGEILILGAIVGGNPKIPCLGRTSGEQN